MSIIRYLKRLIFRLRADYTTEQLIKTGLRVGRNFTPHARNYT